MRIITTRIHGFLDYTVSLLLIISPWLFDFNRGGAETQVPVALGIAGIIYSLLTRYELGAIRLIPMRGHLVLDFLNGLLLATSPWVFGFADYVWLPHVVLGVFEIIASLVTERQPSTASTIGQAAHR